MFENQKIFLDCKTFLEIIIEARVRRRGLFIIGFWGRSRCIAAVGRRCGFRPFLRLFGP